MRGGEDLFLGEHHNSWSESATTHLRLTESAKMSTEKAGLRPFSHGLSMEIWQTAVFGRYKWRIHCSESQSRVRRYPCVLEWESRQRPR